MSLVNDLQALFDLTGLGHGNEFPVITDVDETVLLEDGSEKGVEHDRGRRVRDNTRLLVKLLGEQVNTEVTMLAGLGRGGDADDLARAVLEDDQITNADVVARDGEGALGRLVGRRDVSGLGDVGVVVSGPSNGVVVVDIGTVSVSTVRIVLAHFERVGTGVVERRVRVV